MLQKREITGNEWHPAGAVMYVLIKEQPIKGKNNNDIILWIIISCSKYFAYDKLQKHLFLFKQKMSSRKVKSKH